MPGMLINSINEAGMLELLSQTNVNFAGTDAVKFELGSTEKAQIEANKTIYLFTKNGYLFLLAGSIGPAYDTEENRKLLQEVLQSVRFN